MFHYATGRAPEIRPRRPKQINQLLNRSSRQLFKLDLTWPPEIAHTANASQWRHASLPHCSLAAAISMAGLRSPTPSSDLL
jgi:hypothetical protein